VEKAGCLKDQMMPGEEGVVFRDQVKSGEEGVVFWDQVRSGEEGVVSRTRWFQVQKQAMDVNVGRMAKHL